MINALPRWIETENPSAVTIDSSPIPEEMIRVAASVGLLAERFSLVVPHIGGDRGIIVEPPCRETIPPTPTVLLLALIRRYFISPPIITASQLPIFGSGWAPRRWLCREIAALTSGTELALHRPEPDDIGTCVTRLKKALLKASDRADLLESRQGVGYRFRILPGLITVIIGKEPEAAHH